MGSVLDTVVDIRAAYRLFGRGMHQGLASDTASGQKGLWCFRCIPHAGDMSVAPHTSWEVVA